MPRSTDAQKAISQNNRLSILRLIRDQGETTRLEIASRLQLSHTTVKAYVEALLSEGLIEEAGTAPSMGGRKPVVIRLLPNARFSLGVNFAPGRMDLLLLNLRRDVLLRKAVAYDTSQAFGTVLDRLAGEIETAIADLRLERTRILGIGMTFPGLVDDSRDQLIYLANLGVRDFSLKPFADRIGLPVFAENEAQAAVNAERVLGHAKGKDNLVYVSIAEGIGAGILINGQVYRTGGKNAGEFGHVRISDQPVQCNCGRTGCWERFASREALVSEYARQSGLDEVSIDSLFKAYAQGDPIAAKVLEQYTRNLFKGIDIILLAFSPDDVIIGGDLANHAETVIDLGINKLGLARGFLGYEGTRIMGSALKENAALLGAALLPMDRDAFAREPSASLLSI